ncbi:MAG: ATP-dependent RecD-like DNA helicase [Deltaproteobacteria bacterium]|nr:ATP-dependent RecD-like DNA helicase [Deltaproteobacteria bacterium]
MVTPRPPTNRSLFPATVGSGVVTLEGVLELVTYSNEESGWSVVKLLVPNKPELVTAVGNLSGVQPGENLRLTGRWTVDRKWGEQFRIESFLTLKPATVAGIEKYLGSGLVPGIGPVMAERLVKHFGLQTLEVIDHQPQRLAEVEGIGPVRRASIQAAWEEQREIRQVMVFLQSNGVSSAHAVRIWKQYQDKAIEVVRENPYRLAVDVFGIGFKTADQIARNLGLSPTSPRRAEAGVLHVLSELSGEGHVFLPRSELVEHAREILEIDPALVDDAVAAMAADDKLVVENPEASTASEDGAVYLKSLHAAESGLARALRSLQSAPVSPLAIDIEKALAWFEGRAGLSLAPEQREAIRQAVTSKVLVITGGPGTGKTTLVNGIIQILERKGRRILLAAPTGRAAKRLTETTGREAKTLHRLLEFSPRETIFQRNPENPLQADLVILDETSMVDTALGYHVLQALPPSCQLVLVGDVDQLPSVGPGSVLADLIRSQALPVVRLQHIFRQAEQSLIVANAHRINRGELPRQDNRDGSDFFFLEEEQPEAILATVKSLVRERLPRKFGLDPVREIQVLTPMHRGSLGAAALNLELQAMLNTSGPSLQRGGRTLRAGDKVMQVRNNYDLDVFNGDIGSIEAIEEEAQLVQVRYEDRRVSYSFTELDELVHAYACTVHKAQGSEYPCIVLPLHTQHYPLLQRNLLYTAVTRGKRLVVVVGSKRALGIAVKNGRTGERHTRLAARLRAG